MISRHFLHFPCSFYIKLLKISSYFLTNILQRLPKLLCEVSIGPKLTLSALRYLYVRTLSLGQKISQDPNEPKISLHFLLSLLLLCYLGEYFSIKMNQKHRLCLHPTHALIATGHILCSVCQEDIHNRLREQPYCF
jgi:hypothetical protein